LNPSDENWITYTIATPQFNIDVIYILIFVFLNTQKVRNITFKVKKVFMYFKMNNTFTT